MSGDKNSFEHKSLQDADSIVQYLNEISEGIRNGHLALANGGDEVVLEPHGLIKLSIKASRKKDRGKLTVKLAWKLPETAAEEADSDDSDVTGAAATAEQPADA
ncbi:MAG: amphi-Trp domain-containing protein [Myxococcales bacterium]|nr:amphi-Trp domain-containing protein [Myxococcales bacterium]